MINSPQIVRDARGDRAGPAVLTTVGKESTPKTVYFGSEGAIVAGQEREVVPGEGLLRISQRR